MNEPTAENRARVGGSWRPAPGDRVEWNERGPWTVVAVDHGDAWIRSDGGTEVIRPVDVLAPWEPRRCDACGQEVTA